MFEIKNYSKDYYINKKFIGYVVIEKPDRKNMGYTGRMTETLTSDLRLKNKLYKKRY